MPEARSRGAVTGPLSVQLPEQAPSLALAGLGPQHVVPQEERSLLKRHITSRQNWLHGQRCPERWQRQPHVWQTVLFSGPQIVILVMGRRGGGGSGCHWSHAWSAPLLTVFFLGPTVGRLHPGHRPADPVPAPGPGSPLVVLASLLHRGECPKLILLTSGLPLTRG